MNSQILITLDVDWAPDFVIDFVAEQLINYQVRATWFVTHDSPAIERIRQHLDLFELGIHPNFLPGSTHGSTLEEILQHCMNLVPEAVSVRTHGLAWSSLVQAAIMEQTPITTDVSLFLPHTPHLRPVEIYINHNRLWRVPYYWEDDDEMERTEPQWGLTSLLETTEGLKIFDFHPIHIYLNSSEMGPYEALKQRIPKLSEATQQDVRAFVNDDIGTRTLFLKLIKHMAMCGDSFLVRDISKHWIDLAGEVK